MCWVIVMYRSDVEREGGDRRELGHLAICTIYVLCTWNSTKCYHRDMLYFIFVVSFVLLTWGRSWGGSSNRQRLVVLDPVVWYSGVNLPCSCIPAVHWK